MIEKIIQHAILNPPDSISPEQVKMVLTSHEESIAAIGYIFYAVFGLWLFLLAYTIIVNRNLKNRIKILEKRIKMEDELPLHYPINEKYQQKYLGLPSEGLSKKQWKELKKQN